LLKEEFCNQSEGFPKNGKTQEKGSGANPDGCAKEQPLKKLRAADRIRSRFFWQDGIVDA
jgi:hypothetical protein